MSFRLPRASRKSLASCWGVLFLLLCLPAGLLAQRPLNLDFELPGAAGPGRGTSGQIHGDCPGCCR